MVESLDEHLSPKLNLLMKFCGDDLLIENIISTKFNIKNSSV